MKAIKHYISSFFITESNNKEEIPWEGTIYDNCKSFMSACIFQCQSYFVLIDIPGETGGHNAISAAVPIIPS